MRGMSFPCAPASLNRLSLIVSDITISLLVYHALHMRVSLMELSQTAPFTVRLSVSGYHGCACCVSFTEGVVTDCVTV